MYVLKNALVSIWRNKGRNILMIIIIAVIAASCAITLAIRNSAIKIVNSYEEKYNVEATIGMNREALMQSFRGESEEEKKSQEEMIEAFNDISSLSVEDIDNYGDSKYVKSYYYIYNLNIDALDIEEATDSLVKETTTTEVTTKTETFGDPQEGPGGNRGEYGSRSTTSTTKTETEKIFNDKASGGAFTLLGYNSYEAMSDFVNGSKKITEGEIPNDFTSPTCVISEELATLNDLEVSDTITLVSPNDEDITYDLEITGIFTEDNTGSSDMTNMFSNSVNTIITNDIVVKEILDLDENLKATLTPTFVLTDADVVEEFSQEVEDKGLSEYYTVTNNLETINNATKSIVSVKTFATTFLIITLIIGCIVLLVINMINIRERKYEIGVLRTIGMKKITVITEFVLELLIVALVGLLIGATIGSVSSVKIANKLLENEIANAQEETQNIDQNFGGKGMINHEEHSLNMGINNIEEIDTINAIVDIKVLLELLGIGVLLTLISSISACVSIARFSPLTILKERS